VYINAEYRENNINMREDHTGWDNVFLGLVENQRINQR